MGASSNIAPVAPVSNGDRVLQMIRQKYPGYHPLMAIAEIAHEPEQDPKVRLDCHKTIAKYVAPELRSIDVKGEVTSTRRVIVSLFQDELDANGQPSAPGSRVLEGSAMTLLDAPAVTVADDPLWNQIIEVAAA